MCDSLFCGRRFRTLNIVDDFSREALTIEFDVGWSAERVQRVFDRVVAWREYPCTLHMDNGPEFISTILADWAHGRPGIYPAGQADSECLYRTI